MLSIFISWCKKNQRHNVIILFRALKWSTNNDCLVTKCDQLIVNPAEIKQSSHFIKNIFFFFFYIKLAKFIFPLSRNILFIHFTLVLVVPNLTLYVYNNFDEILIWNIMFFSSIHYAGRRSVGLSADLKCPVTNRAL